MTTGIGADELAKQYQEQNNDYNALMVKALADRLAEAFAELMHLRVRTEFWPYAQDESLSNDDLLDERYQGIRPAPGYPACPEHSDKVTLFKLLGIDGHISMELTRSIPIKSNRSQKEKG